jgi:hypothetical protein
VLASTVEVAMAVSTAIQTEATARSQVLAPITSSSLSPEAQRLLRVAAVFGSSFVLSDVAGVIGEPVGRLLPSIQELLDSRLISARGETLSFPDVNVQTNTYSAIPQPIRMALHRQIGALLLDQGGATAGLWPGSTAPVTKSVPPTRQLRRTWP